jgi:hypothetical protein
MGDPEMTPDRAAPVASAPESAAALGEVVIRPAPGAAKRAVVVALALAPLLAIPVTWSLVQPPERLNVDRVVLTAADTIAVYACVTLAAVLSALAGATAGARLARRHATSGSLVAILLGWTIAVAVVPMLTATAGVPLQAGVVCIDSCTPTIVGSEAGSGVEALYGAVVFAGFFVIPAGVALVLLIAGLIAGYVHRPIAATLLLLLSLAALMAWALMYGALVAFVCLAVGVMAWALILFRGARTRVAPAA